MGPFSSTEDLQVRTGGHLGSALMASGERAGEEGARSGRAWGGEACIDRGGDENRPHHLYSRAAAVSRT